MRINNRDINEVASLLETAVKSGAHILAYNDSGPLSKADIETFKDDFDAMQYSYDNTTDVDSCLLAPIEPVLERLWRLQNAMSVFEGQDQSRSVPFDIPQIVTEHIFNLNFKTKVMNDKNVEYLEKQLQMTGMGEIPRTDLINKITEGEATFTLLLEKKYGDDIARAMPIFRLSDKGNYFFNSYDMTVESEGKQPITQNFKVQSKPDVAVTKGETPEQDEKEWVNSTITFKEAFNQLQGRSVNKDFVSVDKDVPRNNRKYNAWEYLDLANPDTKGEYPRKKVFKAEDIEKTLGNYDIRELKNETYKTDLVESLKRGNRQSVNFIKEDGSTEKMYVEANPRFSALKIYDAQLNPIRLSMKSKRIQGEETQGQSESQATAGTKANMEPDAATKKAETVKQKVTPLKKETAPKKKAGVAKHA